MYMDDIKLFAKKMKRKLKTLMDQKTRKLMMIHKALHSRDDINRLRVKKRRRKRIRQH